LDNIAAETACKSTTQAHPQSLKQSLKARPTQPWFSTYFNAAVYGRTQLKPDNSRPQDNLAKQFTTNYLELIAQEIASSLTVQAHFKSQAKLHSERLIRT
jgi:hypothetical protein